MKIVDQIGNVLVCEKEPRRIVCLVPSITELLFDLGLGNRIVGITKFCIHPITLRETASIIGGTKNVNIQKIKALQPDLIIANQEENLKEQIEELVSFCQVFVSKVDTLQSSLDLISLIGEFFGNPIESTEVYLKLLDIYSAFPRFTVPKSYVYIIWKSPFMAAGSDTFIHHFLANLGLLNKIQAIRYPEIDFSFYKELDYIFLSSEPFPFKRKDVIELQNIVGQNTKVILVDGECFLWYGTRVLKMNDYLDSFLKEVDLLG